VKNRRNNELLAIQNAISEEDNQRLLGERVEVLVEGPSDRARQRGEDQGEVLQLTGRTRCDRIVVFEGARSLIGELVQVAIYDVSPHTLWGVVATPRTQPLLARLE
jgi:tRNA-2-methylthio-N6-dimethylallyladenosine synthase